MQALLYSDQIIFIAVGLTNGTQTVKQKALAKIPLKSFGLKPGCLIIFHRWLKPTAMNKL
jgi:hypothetical protein